MVVDPSTPAGRTVRLIELRWLFSGEIATGHCTSCIKMDRVSLQTMQQGDTRVLDCSYKVATVHSYIIDSWLLTKSLFSSYDFVFLACY
jgi:hypothetical protein